MKNTTILIPTRQRQGTDIKAGAVERIESFETTHFSIVDQWQMLLLQRLHSMVITAPKWSLQEEELSTQ